MVHKLLAVEKSHFFYKKKKDIERNPSTVQSFVIVDLYWTKPTMKITLGRNPFNGGRKRGNVKREKSW